VHGLGKDIWWETWTMSDNPNISEAFKERMKRSYAGVFYKRFILSEWVLAEGSIYRDCLSEANYYDDSSRPPGLTSRGGHVEHVVSIDAGTANAQVYGDWYDDGDVLWLENEYYWDSRVESKQKTNGEYANDLVNGCGEWPGFPKDDHDWPLVIIDPSAASFQAELRARGISVIDGDNEVLEGIRKVSSMLSNRKIRMHRKCKMHKQELETYAWKDPGKTHSSKDEPLKEHDHAPDEVRYMVNTRIPAWRIAA
jgi:PBSX family phage terminase large subunit